MKKEENVVYLMAMMKDHLEGQKKGCHFEHGPDILGALFPFRQNIGSQGFLNNPGVCNNR